MTKEEYEAFMVSLTPFERRVLFILEDMRKDLKDIANVGRDE